MIGLVWNGMMSFGGGWFFLAASEAISVLNKQTTRLPGHRQLRRRRDRRSASSGTCCWPSCVMIVMVLGINFLFWRPLVAWSEKFRIETAARPPNSPRASCSTCCAVRGPAPDRPARPAVGAALRPGHPTVRSGRPTRCAANVARRRVGDVVFGSSWRWSCASGRRRGHCATSGDDGRARRVRALFGLGCDHLRRGWSSGRRLDADLGADRREDRHVTPRWPATPSRSCRSSPASRPTSCSRSPPRIFIATGHQPELSAASCSWRWAPSGTSCSTPSPAPCSIPSDLREAMDDFDVTRLATVARAHPARPSSRPTSPAASPPPAAPGTPPSSPRSSPTDHHTLIAYGLGAYIATGDRRTASFAKVLAGVVVMSVYVVGRQPPVLAASLPPRRNAGTRCDRSSTMTPAPSSGHPPLGLARPAHDHRRQSQDFTTPDGAPLAGARRHQLRPARRRDRRPAGQVRLRQVARCCAASPG